MESEKIQSSLARQKITFHILNTFKEFCKAAEKFYRMINKIENMKLCNVIWKNKMKIN